MLKWRPATDFPSPHVWVLAFRPKQPDVVRYEPYVIVYRSVDTWVNAAGHTIDGITHWMYIRPPDHTTTPPAAKE